jgi:hypothetical protein
MPFNATKQTEILRQQSWQSNGGIANMTIIFLTLLRSSTKVLDIINRMMF